MKILGKNRVAAGFCLALILAGCDQSGQAQTAANDATAADPAPAAGLDSDISQASYLLGYQRAQALVMQTEGAVDMQAFVQGVGDFVAGGESRVSAADQGRLMQALQTAVSEKMAQASAGIREAGDAFRAAYAQQEGVVQLPSGLLYEVLQEGSGPKPTAADTVSTHYHGTLIDGMVFDSSVERGQPASFPVGGVIAGWTEALQLMAVGSKWRLVIPPELAYGDRGAGGDIKPGATLIFEVELLEIK